MKSSKSTIPNGILSNFLEYNIGTGMNKVVDTRCHFLWNRDEVERYRVDVWIQEYCSKFDLNIKKIGYSYFVHFDREAEVLIDKTIKE